MGARGPQPTPSEILKGRGTFRADRRSGEPSVKVARPSCPTWLKGEARAEWNRQVRQLVAMRVIAKVDRAALAVYCDAWCDLVRLVYRHDDAVRDQAIAQGVARSAAGTLDEKETRKAAMIADRLEKVVANLERRKDRATKRLLALSDRFGFTPAARARVKVLANEAGGTQGDGKGRFFGTVG